MRGVVLVVPLLLASFPVAAALEFPAPDWRVGDEWDYAHERPTEAGVAASLAKTRIAQRGPHGAAADAVLLVRYYDSPLEGEERGRFRIAQELWKSLPDAADLEFRVYDLMPEGARLRSTTTFDPACRVDRYPIHVGDVSNVSCRFTTTGEGATSGSFDVVRRAIANSSTDTGVGRLAAIEIVVGAAERPDREHQWYAPDACGLAATRVKGENVSTRLVAYRCGERTAGTSSSIAWKSPGDGGELLRTPGASAAFAAVALAVVAVTRVHERARPRPRGAHRAG